MSPSKDLGTKFSCWKCSTKFYDLNKAVPTCPKCGTDQRESPALKAPEKAKKAPRAAAAPKPKVVEPAEAELEDAEPGAEADADEEEEP